MSIQETEAASAAVAKNQDGRVKLSDMEAAIAFEHTSTLGCLTMSDRVKSPASANNPWPSGALNNVVVHVVVLHSGFVVIGKSAPLDPANFNGELGAKFAREDAIRQLWPLMAFARAQARVS